MQDDEFIRGSAGQLKASNYHPEQACVGSNLGNSYNIPVPWPNSQASKQNNCFILSILTRVKSIFFQLLIQKVQSFHINHKFVS